MGDPVANHRVAPFLCALLIGMLFHCNTHATINHRPAHTSHICDSECIYW